MLDHLIIEPPLDAWTMLPRVDGSDIVLGRARIEWRRAALSELGIEGTTQPIIATGHQPVLWHPGVLAKYRALGSCAQQHQWGTLNVVVDHHVGPFDAIDVPVRQRTGALNVQRVRLGLGRLDMAMNRQPPLVIDPSPKVANLQCALPSVASGLNRIVASLQSHEGAHDAAAQFMHALEDLARPLIALPPWIRASALVGTSLGRALLAAMVHDPWRCAEAYNRAAATNVAAGLAPLIIRDDMVELPLWRIDVHGSRSRAFDPDVQAYLGSENSAFVLEPRALVLTAIMRLALCDLFIHGRGGMIYDQAMEQWLRNWLGVRLAPVVLVTADQALPFEFESPALPLMEAQRAYRRQFHDPGGGPGRAPSPVKRQLIDRVNAHERGTPARRSAYLALHQALEQQRLVHARSLAMAENDIADARNAQRSAVTRARRDWPFPYYEEAALTGPIPADTANLRSR